MSLEGFILRSLRKVQYFIKYCCNFLLRSTGVRNPFFWELVRAIPIWLDAELRSELKDMNIKKYIVPPQQ